MTNESRWIAPSVVLASAAAAVLFRRGGGERRGAAAGLNAYAGVAIGTMAFGHLLAVTINWGLGTIRGFLPLLYAIGIVLIVPAGLVARHGWQLALHEREEGAGTVKLNALLILALLVSGPRNVPLAMPALLNIAHARHQRRGVGRMIVALALILATVLLAGSVRFFLSGQSFEDFSGMPVEP